MFRTNESEVEKWLRLQYFNYTSELGFINVTLKAAKVPEKGVGVIFLDSEDSNHLKYILRTTSGKLKTTDDTRYGEQNGYSMYDYGYSGFITIQTAIDQAYLYILHNIEVSNETYVGALPAIEYNVVDLVESLLPTIISLGFTFIMPSLLKEIVDEKTSGIKEMMKIMGMRSWVNWLNWIVYSLIIYLPVTFVITGLFVIDSGTGPPVSASFLLVWFNFILFTLAFLALILAMSTLFTNGIVAMIAGEVVWYGTTVLLNTFIVSYPDKFSLFINLLSCLCPSIALIWSFNCIKDFQKNGRSWTMRNFFDNRTGGGRVSVGLAFIMLIVDMILYSIITWYIDSVNPGPYGIPKPYNFMFKRSNGKKCGAASRTCHAAGSKNNYEIPPANIKIGIKIENLRKTFKQGKVVAVDKVDLDIYEDNITALLGHNGAGKTTTMSILAGFLPPSEGKVVVRGKSIFDNMDEFRSNLGLCPQHDLLFSFLTVREHLIFFGMLKGLSMSQSEQDGAVLMSKLSIFSKRNEQITKLSGGMKRKLCLAIALMGSPQILILDEPTAGMDLESRHQVWDMLLASRGHRTTIISTHFMEEADVLGDRIAIMAHGLVSCYGTSMFLKKHFGTGYHLNITKMEEAPELPITSAVKEHITDATMILSSASQLNYNIRFEEGSQFPVLFSVLESSKDDLGLTGTSITSTTLEDIFLKIAGGKKQLESTNGHIENANPVREDQKISGNALFIVQLKTLVYKRVLTRIRTWISTLIFIVVPVALMGVAVMKMMKHDYIAVQPKLLIGLRNFPGVHVAVSSDNDTVTGVIEKQVVSESATFDLIPAGTYLNRYLAEKINNSLVQYEKEMIMGFEVYKGTIVGGFSQYFTHSPPLVVNTITNILLQLASPSSTVTVYNHPLSVKAAADACDLSSSAPVHIFDFPLHIIFVSLGLLFLTMNFISFPLTERVSGAKQLQLMTGVSPLLYWLTIFICDAAMYLFTATLMVSMIYVVQTEQILSDSGYMGILVLLFVLFGASGIAFAYFFSFFVKSSVKASVVFIIINLLTGTFGGIFIVILDSSYTTYGIWRQILSFNPLFSMTAALVHLFIVMYINGTCLHCGKDCKTLDPMQFLNSGPNGLHPHGIYSFLIFLLVDAVIYYGILLIIEYGVLKHIVHIVSTSWIKTNSQHYVEDPDVASERIEVHSSHTLLDIGLPGYINKAPILHVTDLGKKYDNKKMAVYGVSFQVRRGECFGLLGVNGAGKSTTFKMLTGEEIPNKGDATILQFSLKNQKSKFLSKIGYCPQFDAINKLLTGKEMLRMYALLRGIPSALCDFEVSRWIDIMGLKEYANRPCGTYSGGNKRKLSTAMAFIGEPPVVFLDEPTTGVDPVSRRKLWEVVSKCQRAGQAIVLTSHSMEECEALCSRLTIMVAGHMKCIGTPEYLKHKFGQGFTIKIKLRPSQYLHHLEQFKQDMLLHFKNCSIKDEHLTMLHYHIPDPSLPLSQLFGSMEQLKRRHEIIEDYQVNDTTLEEVFMYFAQTGASIQV
ncbi:phospholipid-transporting ATPase ABCA1-like isoform X2 [Homalodisca vitripennis]|uniref:phospholipid-transporting ATPase ABCA1-like isoform X2 n=1 Tax=Homalodisca vitripennis TaxID=197043 RepID=UPI001EEB6229|nr:phospholipid-transporting ATPase ABCA1-like isoform X2 [Homalodisca vitripennis]